MLVQSRANLRLPFIMIHAVSLRGSALLYLIVGRLHLARSRERDMSTLHRRDIPTPYFAREWHEHIDFAAHRVEAVGVNRKYCRRCEEIRTYYLRPVPDAAMCGRENFVYLFASLISIWCSESEISCIRRIHEIT
jgi:hypothetical protein